MQLATLIFSHHIWLLPDWVTVLQHTAAAVAAVRCCLQVLLDFHAACCSHLLTGPNVAPARLTGAFSQHAAAAAV
jgi:hypothetical protein